MSCDNTCECFLPEKLIRDSVPKIFIGDCSCMHVLSRPYQSFRLPKWKPVFNINHFVYKNSLGTVRHSCQGIMRALLISMFQDISQDPTIQIGLSKNSNLRSDKLTFFLHSILNSSTIQETLGQ